PLLPLFPYTTLFRSGNTREPFDTCAIWSEWSGLETGIAVAPLSVWSVDDLASVSKETVERCRGRFILGIGAGRETKAPIQLMRRDRKSTRLNSSHEW